MRDLADRGRVCTRQVLSEITGLKLSIVDDHIKRMKDEGSARMVVNGVFELVDEVAEDRPVSATYLPNGRVKVEIGDELLDLTLREARALGMAVSGTFLQFVNVR